jgi:hypothetical protein
LWSRPCADKVGTGTPVADAYAERAFGRLAAEPGLQIRYPILPIDAPYSDPVSSVSRVPGGLFISLQGYTPAAGNRRIVAVVDDSGSLRWRRCLIDMNGWASVVDIQRGVIDVEAIPPNQTNPTWWAFDLLTGTSQVETQRSADDLEAAAMARFAEPDVGFNYADPPEAQRLRRVDADGNVLWTREDVYGTSQEGFRTSGSQTNGTDDVTLVYGCVGEPIDPYSANTDERCPFALLGIDTDDGRTHWQLDGSYAVPLVADDYAIITPIPTIDATSELLDVFTGQIVPDGISSEPNAFLEECCGGSDYNRVEGEGAVAWTVATDILNVWYPADVAGPGIGVDLLDP